MICPDIAEWTHLVDGEVSANRSAEMERHAAACRQCARHFEETRALLADVAASLPSDAGSVARVMRALDEAPAASTRTRSWHSFALGALAGGALVAAAAAVLFFVSGPTDQPGTFVARGSGADATLERNVGIEIHADGAPVVDGRRLAADAPLTASVRNLFHDRRVYMLLFAIDARGDVHWIFPGYTDPATDPQAIALPRADRDTPLGESVVFDRPAPGLLRIVVVLSFERLRVSHIETTAPTDRDPDALRDRWPDADIRTLTVTVPP